MSIEIATELSIAPDRLHRLTLDQYHGLIESGVFGPADRLVLLDGLLVRKMAKGPRHSTAAEVTREMLSAALPIDWHVRIEQPIMLPGGPLGHDSEPEPDLVVVAGSRRAYVKSHPGPGDVALVIEIAQTMLAEERRSLVRDACAEIPVAWIVNLTNDTVEVYTDPSGPGYRKVQVMERGDSLTFMLLGRAPVGPFPPSKDFFRERSQTHPDSNTAALAELREELAAAETLIFDAKEREAVMSRMDPLIDRYAAGGPLLVHATSGLAHEHETTRIGPGTWSIAELVAHLLDADLVHADRMKRVIAEDDPVLQAFDENRWIERLDSNATPVTEAVNLLAANRHWMARILRKCSDADFGRVGHHTEVGRNSLAELLANSVSHVDHHLRFLFAKRAALGVALIPHYSHDAPVERRDPVQQRQGQVQP